ncbi:hypothetical protein B0H11DRAFT_2050730 [Mycena galericulata]|nr:hypothetical protein B0H11DRAFT_2050730 [Mycena galericulata]
MVPIPRLRLHPHIRAPPPRNRNRRAPRRRPAPSPRPSRARAAPLAVQPRPSALHQATGRHALEVHPRSARGDGEGRGGEGVQAGEAAGGGEVGGARGGGGGGFRWGCGRSGWGGGVGGGGVRVVRGGRRGLCRRRRRCRNPGRDRGRRTTFRAGGRLTRAGGQRRWTSSRCSGRGVIPHLKAQRVWSGEA